MSLLNRSASLSCDYAEIVLRFLIPIVVHWCHVNIVNSAFNIVMLEPDFGSIVFVTSCSLYLRKFKSVILHEVYRSNMGVVRIIQEVSGVFKILEKILIHRNSDSQIFVTLVWCEMLLRCGWIPLNYLLYYLITKGYIVSVLCRQISGHLKNFEFNILF